MKRSGDAVTVVRTIQGWRIASLVGLGTLWGLSELLGGPTLRLTATALILLAAGRTILNLPGSSIALAGVAVLFRSVTAAPFHCHLAGITLLGVSFDIMATGLLRANRFTVLRGALVGGGASLLSAFLFAASMVWIFEFRSWPEGGSGRVAEHVTTSGGLAALAGIVLVPLGLWIGHEFTRVAGRHPYETILATASGCALLWVTGLFV